MGCWGKADTKSWKQMEPLWEKNWGCDSVSEHFSSMQKARVEVTSLKRGEGRGWKGERGKGEGEKVRGGGRGKREGMGGEIETMALAQDAKYNGRVL